MYGNARFGRLHGLARVGYLCILRTDDLLGDVPDSTVVVKEEQSVGSGDVVKRRRLLVAEEHVWNPDLGPAVVAELQLAVVVVALRVEHQTTVVPLLTQVHAQREILHQSTAPPTSAVTTSRVSHRRREMYCGHARLCVRVCVSVCPRPHSHTIARTRM